MRDQSRNRVPFLARVPVMLGAVSTSLLMAGCSNMNFTSTTPDASFQPQTMAGAVHGGQAPISGATVTLYAVGTSGYGSAATALATSTTASDGTFTLNLVATQPKTLTDSYACPTSNTLVYLISSGGITDGSGLSSDKNNAAVLMAALGNCAASGALSVVVNEVSTAASVLALAQYINPGTAIGSENVGSPATAQAQIGILNAFNNVPLLENIATGNAVTSTTLSGTAASVASVIVTASPEPNKINTIADILAQCVNDNPNVSSADCTTLFTNATPPDPKVTSQPSATFATAVDTLQAAYYMATNPTDGSASNLGNLYTLALPASPFQPTLAAVPTDWTVGILFASGGLASGQAPKSPASPACSNGTSNGYFINVGYAVSIDASGNVWMANGGQTSVPGTLSEMGPAGTPMYCSPGISTPKGGAAIDTAGNVWIGSVTATPFDIYKYDGTAFNTIATTAAPYAVAADGAGNADYTSTGTTLNQLPSSAVAGTTPTSIGTTTANAYGLAIDTRGTIATAHGATAATTSNTNISIVNESTVGSNAAYTSAVVTNATNFSSPDLFALDASGRFWFSNNTGTAGTSPGNTTSYITPTYSTNTAGAAVTVMYAESTPTSVFAGGLSNAKGVAIDGAGNVWFANSIAATSGKYALTEFTKTGVALSPTVVVTATTQNGGFQKQTTLLNLPYGMAIDPSGNVWVSMVTANQALSILTEVVGAAVPVVTPISAQLSSGTGPVKP